MAKEKKKKQAEPDVNVPEPKYDYGKDITRQAKSKKTARIITGSTSFVLIVLFIISLLGYTLGQYFATATTMSLKTNAPEIALGQIGFRLTTPIDSIESQKYGLTIDDKNNPEQGYVYWTGSEVSSQTMQFIYTHQGHSPLTGFEPVTSRSFTPNTDLASKIQLYSAFSLNTVERHITQDSAASKTNYFSLDILFRLVVVNDVPGQVALDNFGVYFNKDTKIVANDQLKKALRLGFSSSTSKDIINPGLKSGEGYTNVGAKLDFDSINSAAGRYGYYDYATPIFDIPGEAPGQTYEIAYGDFDPELTNANWGEVTLEDGVIPENHSIYNAATKGGVRPLINYTPAKQYYSSFEKYTFNDETKTPIAYTNTEGLVEFNLLMWLEGWDEFSSNNLDRSTFGAQLKFEVAKRDIRG